MPNTSDVRVKLSILETSLVVKMLETELAGNRHKMLTPAQENQARVKAAAMRKLRESLTDAQVGDY